MKQGTKEQLLAQLHYYLTDDKAIGMDSPTLKEGRAIRLFGLALFSISFDEGDVRRAVKDWVKTCCYFNPEDVSELVKTARPDRKTFCQMLNTGIRFKSKIKESPSFLIQLTQDLEEVSPSGVFSDAARQVNALTGGNWFEDVGLLEEALHGLSTPKKIAAAFYQGKIGITDRLKMALCVLANHGDIHGRLVDVVRTFARKGIPPMEEVRVRMDLLRGASLGRIVFYQIENQREIRTPQKIRKKNPPHTNNPFGREER